MPHAFRSSATLSRLTLALCVLTPAGLSAQTVASAASAPTVTPTVDTRLTAALRWRNLGPFRAGRVGAVSGAIGQPGTFYAGYPGGGLWKTTSAGQTWFPVFDGVKAVSSVGAVEVAPSNPDIVYVGTGDMVTGGTLDQGNGVYKSTDAGRTWTAMGLETTRHIQTMLVDPKDPNTVLVGALGDHINRTDARGVFRSTDGGTTWVQTLALDLETGVTKLARAFDEPMVIYATTARHYAGPENPVGSYRSWQFSSVPSADSSVVGSALYKSVDGGVTWKRVRGEGLPALEGRLGVAVAMGTYAQRVYLISNSALYRSDDGGASWRRMAADDDRIHNGQGGYSCGVYVDPKNPDVVITLNTAAYISRDGGATFTGLKGAPGGDDPQQWWIDPTNGQRMLAGYDQGATVSLDGGATWSSWYNQSTEQIYHLAVDNSFPAYVYGTQQDAGAVRTRLRGNYGAVTVFDWNSVNGWEWGTILPDTKDPLTVYASGNGIVKIRYPSEQWSNVSPAVDPSFKPRTTSSQPLLFAPWDQKQLLAGFQMVMSSTDGGAHWTRISPDLGQPADIDSVTAMKTLGGRGAIESMAASSVGRGILWVGTNNGLIHVTRNGGRTWTEASVPGLALPRRSNISAIATAPHAAGTAYVAVEYMRIGDHKPYVFRTRDFGKTWTSIVTGLPTDEPSGSFARVIRADPVKDGLLYLGTESGVYVSFDEGDHWQSLQGNLPNTPVRDMQVAGNDLVIATHGRGIWVMDNAAVLRQMTPALAAASMHLFAPATAVRLHRNVNANTPLPPEIPHAENPEVGVTLDYWLATAPKGPVRIEVRDAAGMVVRTMTSVAQAPVPEAARPPHPNFWVAPPFALPAAAGANRATWDLRRDAPPAFSHSFEINANPGLTPASPEGPLVAPGKYSVRLIVDGAVQEQSVQVVNDPRSPASSDAVAQQASLTAAMATGMQHAWAYHQAGAALRGAIAAGDTASGSPGAALRAALDSLLGTGGRRSGGKSFRSVSDALAAQLNAQDTGDLAPTPGMIAALRATCEEVRALEAQWQQVLANRLPAYNKARSAAQLAQLAVPVLPTTGASCGAVASAGPAVKPSPKGAAKPAAKVGPSAGAAAGARR